MSFAILGANAALVPNRVRIAKANNTRVVSTVTVAVRPTFPALDASPISIPIPSRVVRSISRSARLRTARAARDARLDGGSRALFLDRPETDVARAIFLFCSFPFLRDWVHGRNDPKSDASAFSRKSAPRVNARQRSRRRTTTDPSPRDSKIYDDKNEQGTGKGYGRHTHHKDTHMEIDYKKHIPGYDNMSRPQKYRARKSVKAMINKMEHDRGQHMAVKNTSDFAKKAFAFYQSCVDACEELECVQECKVEWDM